MLVQAAKRTVDMNIILASASPRRRELLTSAGIAFSVISVDTEENMDGTLLPEEHAKQNALVKAQAVAKDHAEACVLGADTIVVNDGNILGKPQDEVDAENMLTRLSGSVHEVITGVALVSPQKVDQWFVRTEVEFRDLTPREITAYIATKEPMDKAGAYGIQSGAAHFVRRINGSYTNVVGFPLAEVVERLRSLGV